MRASDRLGDDARHPGDNSALLTQAEVLFAVNDGIDMSMNHGGNVRWVGLALQPVTAGARAFRWAQMQYFRGLDDASGKKLAN